MGILQKNGAMLNDLYQLTMAYAYWKNGMKDYQAAFHMFYRKAPFTRSLCCFLRAGSGH